MNKRVMGSGSAPGFAKPTGAAPIAKAHERAHSKNVFDQAKKAAPNKGQTSGAR